MRIFALLICLSLTAGVCDADIIQFRLTGAGGDGLLGSNISPDTGELGSGGIGATGVTFNTDNNLFHIDVVWGSANGFTDLSQDVERFHLHGPTANGFADGHGQVAPLILTLQTAVGFDGSASSGGLNDNFLLDDIQEEALLAGRTYLNVHLTTSDTGIIRGYLTPVPEPMSTFPVAVAALMAVSKRRRRSLPR